MTKPNRRIATAFAAMLIAHGVAMCLEGVGQYVATLFATAALLVYELLLVVEMEKEGE